MENGLSSLLSKSLGMPEKTILNYANQNKDHYAKAKIRKKHSPNSYRTVFLPPVELKIIQRFLVDWYFKKLPVHESAKAYRQGLNVCNNAIAHIANSHFLMLDIHNFFDSMKTDFFRDILIKNNVFSSEKDADLAIRLCSRRGVFVQGCVSSPFIANAYLYYFDIEMESLAHSLPGGVYTRYSDDITISSTQLIPENLIHEIASKLKKYHLFLNEKKTRFCSNLERLKITGIRIKNNKQLGLDTAFKKQLKKEIYKYLKSGQNENEALESREKLFGKLAYLRMVDPHYYNVLLAKYELKGRNIHTILKCRKNNGQKNGPKPINLPNTKCMG